MRTRPAIVLAIRIERPHAGLSGRAIAEPAEQFRDQRGPRVGAAPRQFFGADFAADEFRESLGQIAVGTAALDPDLRRDRGDFSPTGGGTQCIHVVSVRAQTRNE